MVIIALRYSRCHIPLGPLNLVVESCSVPYVLRALSVSNLNKVKNSKRRTTGAVRNYGRLV